MVQYRFLALAAATTAVTAKISVEVHRSLEVAKQSNIRVKFHCGEAHANHRRRLKAGASRTETVESVVHSLKEHTRTSQAPVKLLLANQSTAVEVDTTWIDCSMYIDKATNDLIMEIDALEVVKSIDKPGVKALDESKSDDDQPASAVNETIAWGINTSQAPELWAKDIKGDGIVVGIIDTGVRHTHEALRSNWRKEYGWFDPYDNTELPHDYNGHGTGVTSIMVGKEGIGVAPNAQWIACKGLALGYNIRLVMKCAQFLLCPHDRNGNNADCSKAPHVINNSFAKYELEFWMEDTIAAWRAAGIIPVFANGNDGAKGCAHSGYPAASPQVIAVGATERNDFVRRTSSFGPSVRNSIKPDISAPGADIRSASNVSDVDYLSNSGTSFAAPHVSGAIALYLSANKGASYDEVYTALANNVDTDTLTVPNNICGEKIPNAQYPNNIYGYGRLNIFKAVNATLPNCTLWTDDFEVIGKEVKNVSQSTAGNCCDECRNTPNCNAFTFTRDNGGTCWLKAENKSVDWVYKKGSKSARVLKPNNDLTSCGTLEEDVTYGGPTVAVTYQAKAESCCADCENIAGCKLFVWYGGTCWLKSAKGAKGFTKGAKSGSLPTSSACAPIELNVNYVGHDINFTNQTSADACCGDCQATSGCKLFVWSRGMCTLKSAMGTNETVDGAKAGFLLAGQAS
ncbi:hypothetical protein H257_19297 [Aphanomyces astaci]|uniref:subtilisin n=1 Tax=Aphanomyces astaci TaxID=112090 RepID=W4F8J2_APHAT|nr:hypothetical protein H257_19297 [Aphanomyces astaci]ETV63772.1 hypothetical protein H257_19297 [Aphanomyces astaci]|eukprot:XP_009846744.1 hypothetical protein H257_19297 [Aphanomyces astaci]